MPKTPWIGLLALAALFVVPYLPDWLFEGPHTVKHRPRRHVCGDCGRPWTEGHDCDAQLAAVARPPLQGTLDRPQQMRRGPWPLTGRRERPALGPRFRGRS
jgi:hypothetical protein